MKRFDFRTKRDFILCLRRSMAGKRGLLKDTWTNRYVNRDLVKREIEVLEWAEQLLSKDVWNITGEWP